MRIDTNEWKLDIHQSRETLFVNIALVLFRRVFFATKGGDYGIAGMKIKKGDQLVHLFPPAYCPFIVRPRGNKDFQLVSVAYIPPKKREDAKRSRWNVLHLFDDYL
jgi:hypothetical protein